MFSEKILVIGGGLAGISLSHYLSRKNYSVFLVESNSYFGGYFINDTYKDPNLSGNKLVLRYLSYLDNSNVERSVLSTGARISDSIYVIKPGRLLLWNGLAVSATGFRCKTPTELKIYGNRPARVYCINTVMEMLRDGYIPGENPVIYGLNRYTVSLANNLMKISSIKSVTIVSENLKYIPSYLLNFIENNKIRYIKGKIIQLDSYSRVSKIKLDNGNELKGDSLIIGIIAPFNYLNLNYSVGNASMIITDPQKIIKLSEIFAENMGEILYGSDIIKLPENLRISPLYVSRNIRKVMIGYPKGTKIIINDNLILLKENYEVIKLPDSNEITIKVVK